MTSGFGPNLDPDRVQGLVDVPLRDWIRARTGISITDQNQAPVELALRMEAERHALDPALYLNRLLSGALPPQAFIDAVTTNESYFFRALDQMRVTVTRLIPDQLARRPGQPVRILSLPCARGEEPYSIAILCEEHRLPPQSVEIVGADISATCVADARRGRYGPLALRRTDAAVARQWFTPVGPRAYQLEPALLPRVSLYRLNLLEDAELVLNRRFDIVFCENLLIYFDPETTAAALAALGRLLAPDGWLFVDHAEWNIPRGRFRMQERDGCVGFRPLTPAAGIAPDARRPAAPWPPVSRQPAPAAVAIPVPDLGTPIRPAPPRARTPLTRAAPARPAGLGPAEAHYQAKRFAEALAAFDAVLATAPNDPRARLGRARVLADCGEDFEALEVAEALLHGADEGELSLGAEDYVEALVLIGLLLHKKGLKDLAQGYLREVQRRDPRHPSLGLLHPVPPGPDHG